MVCILAVTIVTMLGMAHLEHSKLIDSLGGTGAVADLCGGITSQAVSKWRRTGIPIPWLKFLELKRPELFEQKVRDVA